jgi:Coenzyme PQQ synthesis protein D (PqqD)
MRLGRAVYHQRDKRSAADAPALTRCRRASRLVALGVPMSHLPLHPITVPGDVVARKVGDVTILVRLQTNRIYELNLTGSRIWELLKENRSRSEIVDTLVREFDENPETIGTALDDLLGRLRSEGLV